MNVIRGGPGDEGLRQVILLTDGHTYGDEQSCLALAEAAGQEGIGISALGIGHEWNDVFLDRLTGISGGSTQFVRSTRDLDGMLNKILAGAGMMYARRVRLEYREDEHLALRYAMRLQPDVTSLPLQSPLVLGNLQRGKGISLLMEVVVSPAEDDIDMLQLLDGRLKMHVFDNGVRPARLFIDVRCPLDDSAAAEVPPPKLMEAVARMTLYRMQENARKQVEAGEADKAARQLQFLATNLLSRGNREFAHSVLAEAEHIRQSRVFSKDGDKHMKYGTRALLLPSGMEPRS
jgi:Ca-activated chloride channel family protein